MLLRCTEEILSDVFTGAFQFNDVLLDTDVTLSKGARVSNASKS
jgi:hypothetical protein